MAQSAWDIPSIHRLIEIHDDSDKLADINTDYHKAITEITSMAASQGKASATLTITIAMEAHTKGVDVAIAHTVKLPKKSVAKSSYFVTAEGDTLTTQNPNQREMFGGRDMSPNGVSSRG